MRWFNWAEEYRLRPTVTGPEILAAVEKLEHGYWPWLIFGLAIHILGVTLMALGFLLSLKTLIVGVFFALDGSILMATLKIMAHVRLQGFRIMLQTENRIEQELRRMDATEL